MYSWRGPSAWLLSVATSWHGRPFNRPASNYMGVWRMIETLGCASAAELLQFE